MLEDFQRIVALPKDEYERQARELFEGFVMSGDASLRDICMAYFMGVYPRLDAWANGWVEVGDEWVLDAGCMELRCRRALGPRPVDAPSWQWAASFVSHDELLPFAGGFAFGLDHAQERAILAARLRVVSCLPFML